MSEDHLSLALPFQGPHARSPGLPLPRPQAQAHPEWMRFPSLCTALFLSHLPEDTPVSGDPVVFGCWLLPGGGRSYACAQLLSLLARAMH